MRLKVKLFRYKTFVFGEVTYIDESLRGKGTLICNNGFTIRSDTSPTTNSDTLYVCGLNRASDNNIMRYQFPSEAEAKRYCAAIKKLIDELNNEEPNTSTNDVIREI